MLGAPVYGRPALRRVSSSERPLPTQPGERKSGGCRPKGSRRVDGDVDESAMTPLVRLARIDEPPPTGNDEEALWPKEVTLKYAPEQAHAIALQQEIKARHRAEDRLKTTAAMVAEVERKLLAAESTLVEVRDERDAATVEAATAAVEQQQKRAQESETLTRSDPLPAAQRRAQEAMQLQAAAAINAETAVVTRAMSRLDAKLHAVTATVWQAASQLQVEAAARRKLEASARARASRPAPSSVGANAGAPTVAALEAALAASQAASQAELASLERSMRERVESAEVESAARLAAATAEIGRSVRQQQQAEIAFQGALDAATRFAAAEVGRELESLLSPSESPRVASEPL